MTEPIREYEGTWEEVAQHADEFAGQRVRLIVLPAVEAENGGKEPEKSIEDVIAELSAEIPEEEWDKVPADLTDQLDHYIYGTPKK